MAQAYVIDQVIANPQAPLATPWNLLGGNRSELQELQSLFTNGAMLSPNWRVVYRQGDVDLDKKEFLCLNWAKHRIANDLRNGQRFPKEGSDGTTDSSVGELCEQLCDVYNLVECPANDADRMVVLWAVKPHRKATVGHIQVKNNGQWESKLSTAIWVISHPEDDFQYYNGPQPLVKFGALKRRV